MYFTEVAEMLKDAKLDYACSANLLDSLDDLESMNMPEEALAFLDSISHPLLREEMRDYYINRQFRKDLYVKGGRKLTRQQAIDSILATKFVIVGSEPQKLEFTGYYRKINFKPEMTNLIYGWLKANNSKPRSFTAFAEKHPGIKPLLLCKLLIIMTELNIIEPCQPEETALAVAPVTRRLNSYICQRALHKEEISALASPVTGYAFSLNRISQMFLHFLWEGKKESVLPNEVWNVLQSQKQRLVKDEKTLETDEENLAELKQMAKDFMEKKLPALKALGIY